MKPRSLKAPRRKVRSIAGDAAAAGRRFTVIVSRFNDFITRALLEGCLDQLLRHGADPELVETVWVPGALELATAAKKVAGRGSAHAIITLGCVIRGDT